MNYFKDIPKILEAVRTSIALIALICIILGIIATALISQGDADSINVIVPTVIIGLVLISVIVAIRINKDPSIENESPEETCEYVESFRRQFEKPIEFKDGKSEHIKGARAYRFLNYMFENQKFDRFLALDLAFERWLDLLEKDSQDRINVSKSIFKQVENLLQDRCLDFRRILLVTEETIFSNSSRGEIKKEAREILTEIKKFEEKPEYEDKIKTKLMVFDDIKQSNEQEQVFQCCDFALFEVNDNGKTPIAIKEIALTTPEASAPIDSSRHELVKRKDELDLMRQLHSTLWNHQKCQNLNELI